MNNEVESLKGKKATVTKLETINGADAFLLIM